VIVAVSIPTPASISALKLDHLPSKVKVPTRGLVWIAVNGGISSPSDVLGEEKISAAIVNRDLKSLGRCPEVVVVTPSAPCIAIVPSVGVVSIEPAQGALNMVIIGRDPRQFVGPYT